MACRQPFTPRQSPILNCDTRYIAGLPMSRVWHNSLSKLGSFHSSEASLIKAPWFTLGAFFLRSPGHCFELSKSVLCLTITPARRSPLARVRPRPHQPHPTPRESRACGRLRPGAVGQRVSRHRQTLTVARTGFLSLFNAPAARTSSAMA